MSKTLCSHNLLTRKPILYVANVDETEITHEQRGHLEEQLVCFAEKEGNMAIRLCGKLEQEIAVLPDDEKAIFLEEYNLPEPGLNKLIHAGFRLLELETFFTGGDRNGNGRWSCNKSRNRGRRLREL